MAQADSVSITSRRKFLAGSAVASVAIVTPLAAAAVQTAPAKVSDELADLGGRLYEAFDAKTEASAAAWAACEEIKEWRRKNPEPRRVGDDGEEVPNHLAIAKKWMKDHQGISRKSGQAKKMDAYHAAARAFDEVVGDIYEFAAKTMADIRFKAELAVTADSDDHQIANSLAYDIVNFEQPAAA